MKTTRTCVHCSHAFTTTNPNLGPVLCPRCQRHARPVREPEDIDSRDVPGTRSHWRDVAKEKYGE